MKIHNLMEDIVIRTLNELLKEMDDICKCEKCKTDMAAFALNNLPPKYIVTEKGELFAKAENMSYQFEADVTKEVIKAIRKVSKEPHHTMEL